jgi:DMSO/TMAO reductase YedYZ molybdopterin-dependent catalytic subunit
MTHQPPLRPDVPDQQGVSRVSLPLALLSGLSVIAAVLGIWWFAYQAGFSTFPPYDLADLMIRLAPGDVAVWAIANLQFAARELAKIGGLAVFIAIGALLGLAARQVISARSALFAGAVGATLCTGLALANDTASGIFWPVWLLIWFSLTLALPAWLMLRAFERLHATLNDRSNAPADWQEMNRHLARRDLLRSMIGAVVFLGGGGWLAGALVRNAGFGRVETADGVPLDERRTEFETVEPESPVLPTPVPATPLPETFDAPDGIRPRQTSIEDFYVIDITTRKPALPDDSWTLRVHGLVDQPLLLSYRDLLDMPAVEQYGNLMCISFTYDNNLIGATRWTGVPLVDVLERAGVQAGALDVVLRGAGGYSDSIRIEKARDPRTLLAYGMDGETLTRDHGFPCRLYVPDIYGEKNVKWLQEIEVVDFDYKGYWQERGWSDDATINVLATIDTPGGTTSPDENGIVPVGGVTFAGERGIERVSIRINDGDWIETDLEDYDPELTWQRWRYDWAPEPGEYRLTVQAVDGRGELQDVVERDPYPDGMTGLHEVTVRIN